MKKICEIVIIPCILLALTCCATKYIEVPVETIHTEYKTDSIYIQGKSEKSDSIVYKDSVVTVVTDSIVYVERWHSAIQKKTNNAADTVYKDKFINVIDSIDKPVYITKEVEVNKIYWWLKILMYLGSGVLLVLLGYVGYHSYKFYKTVKS